MVRREHGFALLLVLWTLVLLTLITTHLVALGRTEARLAANLLAAAAAEALADGAIHEAMFRLLDASPEGWRADGAPRRLALPGGTAEIRIEDQAGLVNPSTVPPPLMAALLRRVGADARQAETIAAAVGDWVYPDARASGAKAPQYRAAGRGYAPPETPFRSVAELGLVLGMTPDLLARLTPHLTVFYEGEPDPAAADPVVSQAIRDVVGNSVQPGRRDGDGPRVVAITAAAVGREGGRFTRRAVVRLAREGGRLHRVLAWERIEG